MPCTLCGQEGHNRRTCQTWGYLEVMRREQIAMEMEQTPVISPPETPPYPPPAPIRINIGGQGRVGQPIRVSRTYRAIYSATNDMSVVGLRIERNLLPDFESNSTTNDMFEDSNLKKLVTQCEQPFEATDCGICMEELKKTNKFVTRCGHQFCGCCMIRHMRTQDFCPSCRGVLG